jgi:hypothetical protein
LPKNGLTWILNAKAGLGTDALMQAKITRNMSLVSLLASISAGLVFVPQGSEYVLVPPKEY